MNVFFLCDSFYPSFLADLILGTLGAFLGIVGAYYLYFISLKQSKEDRLKYVVSLIENIVPSLTNQAGYCNEHSEIIINKPYDENLLKLEANRDTKRLADKVDQEGVFHAYLWKYKRSDKIYKEFKIIYGYIDYIDYIIDELVRTNEKILNSTWERKKQYSMSFKKLVEIVQEISLTGDLITQQPDFVTYSSKLLQDFSEGKKDGENLVESYELVVVPLKRYIVKNAKTHQKITQLLFVIEDLSNQYLGIELSAKHNSNDYKFYGKELLTKAIELNEITKQLQNDYSTSS